MLPLLLVPQVGSQAFGEGLVPLGGREGVEQQRLVQPAERLGGAEERLLVRPGAQPGDGVVVPGRGPLDQGAHQEVGLVLEPGVDRAGAEPGPAGDVPDAGAVIAPLGEHLRGRVEQPFPNASVFWGSHRGSE